MYSRLLVLVLLVCFLSSCESASLKAESKECLVGQKCVLDGKLSLHAGQPPAWVANLDLGGKCAKLALPDDFYEMKENVAKWDGVQVLVVGRAFLQPGFDDSSGEAKLWYMEGDRKIAMGMCDHGVGIYVESMTSESGQSWR